MQPDASMMAAAKKPVLNTGNSMVGQGTGQMRPRIPAQAAAACGLRRLYLPARHYILRVVPANLCLCSHPRRRFAMSNAYVPPAVWQWQEKDDNTYASINRPTAGARFEQKLPVGRHPLQLYSLATPNGQKVSIL